MRGGVQRDRGLVATGIGAGLLWWSYFDRVQPALEFHAERVAGRERGRFECDADTSAHLPIIAGVILIAVVLRTNACWPLLR